MSNMHRENKNQYTEEEILDAIEKDKKGIDKLKDKITKKIFTGNISAANDAGYENNLDYLKKVNRDVDAAYFLLKSEFEDVERDCGMRYFEHLRAVATIILDHFETATPNQIIAALGHDWIEDTKATFKSVANLKAFGPKTALTIQAISKKDWKQHPDLEGQTEFSSEIEKKYKDIRNQEYFNHLKSFKIFKDHVQATAIEYGCDFSQQEIHTIAMDAITVKLSDRIHNLSTQWDENNIEKVTRKIEETETYFLEIAKEVNPIAYKMIQSEILNLKMKLQKHNVTSAVKEGQKEISELLKK